ncbi:MAG TPA: valine--tRNA ligase, partial [Planctomycetota bacterium]|nr:valine--tRNA ligase [Planctomycetota bacterium]
MTDELSSRYDPKDVEGRIYKLWLDEDRFHAGPNPAKNPYVIMIPLPNVTGALHLGHALNETLQDLLTRWHRMLGDEALWMPGTDHAGIATQAVVERKILEEEGKTRYDLGRRELVRRIWQWKELYGGRILEQLRTMGCSCDWARTRFTLDAMCAKAVRWTFFRLFERGLIYRGKRLVNWDPVSQTALSDDELEHETVHTSFWNIRYPLADGSGHVTVATTRPETMLGDTAVAINPADPRAKDLVGRTVILPLMDREIPIIADDYVSLPGEGEMAEFSTGFLKVTPGHDPNDFEIGERHGLEVINIFNADATVNARGGKYEGLDRFEARKVVVRDLEALGLVESEKPYTHEVAHSDRSKAPIEPWLSDQWFVDSKDLAKLAMDAVRDGRVRFFPQRYTDTCMTWLENLRDWCISRQLWWGHRIPIWRKDLELPADVAPEPVEGHELDARTLAALYAAVGGEWDAFARGGGVYNLRIVEHPEKEGWVRTYVCLRDEGVPLQARLEEAGWVQDEDVLDTWFSSALWPHSTLGWPDETPELDYFYPGSCLVTSRDIITLWVARMVMMGLFNVGDVPFRDVYIHAKILDGKGETMSKSKGNGVDPIDIIEEYGADAMRFSIAHMTGETQDIRMPVEKKTLPDGREVNISQKFEIGRNFCNKLWNAARFVLSNLDDYRDTAPVAADAFDFDDRWILSRLAKCVAEVTDALEGYHFGLSVQTIYAFFWNEYCDWYLERAKAKLDAGGDTRRTTQRVLTFALDRVLRLLQPTIPFICEAIWEKLNEAAADRDLTAEVKAPPSQRVIVAAWPGPLDGLRASEVDDRMEIAQGIVRAVREVRGEMNIAPRASVDVVVSSGRLT